MIDSPKLHASAFLTAVLACCVCAPAALAQGAVQRWVDADGRVQYGDRVPAGSNGSIARASAPDSDDGDGSTSLAELEVVRSGDASEVHVSNRLAGPLEITLSFSEAVNVIANPALPLTVVIPGQRRTLVNRVEPGPGQVANYALQMSAVPGDPFAMTEDLVYSMPVPEDSGWEVGQSFHGGFSHGDEQNRYALDLIVPEGTPILAARGGVVMQVESGFDSGGLNRKQFSSRANVVRILHDDGSMAVYAHLKPNGVQVQVGDRVGIGQQIALSGNTGYSSGPHLHFSLQVNRGMRLVSIPFRMVGDRGFLSLPE